MCGWPPVCKGFVKVMGKSSRLGSVSGLLAQRGGRKALMESANRGLISLSGSRSHESLQGCLGSSGRLTSCGSINSSCPRKHQFLSVRPDNVRVNFFSSVSLFDRKPFFRPDLARQGAARSRGQDWPQATAGGGMVLTAVSTTPGWWGRAEDRSAAGRQTALRRMTAQTVRAILLANATAATITGLRARS